AIFALIIARGLIRLNGQSNLFVVLAGVGFLTQFGFQAVINMSTALNLMPTKGMTLPFVSYGGSSMLGMALTMGLFLAISRRRPKRESL
ncbi:MAG: FtsW/RodA/SpoVE family cell cycle protein, partial [Sphaerospermopsis sp. SIO1G2]|nr:FtsW/RodA/SpoVE family cell cycle protein [Sphaerospermopsis sp. SIO1G2]